MEDILYYCQICNEPVYTKIGSGKYCSRKCANTAGQKKEKFVCPICNIEIKTSKSGFTQHLKLCEKIQKKQESRINQWIYEQHKCETCGKIMTKYFGSGRFCSRSCANSREHSEEEKQKISQSIDLYNIQKGIIPFKLREIQKCINCGKDISFQSRSGYCKNCSIKHVVETLGDSWDQILQDAGKKAAAKHQKRSKHEIAFCNLCEQFFREVKHNEPIFNGWDADIIIEDLNIAILWNGPWHYKEIMKGTSLKQIQNRDKIKIKEIIKCGYTPYIIEDLTKTNNTKKVQQEFEILLNYIQCNYML